MSVMRLSALDASFLGVETSSAHMHVGWAALFDPPKGRTRPSFEQFRDHIRTRLPRAPRFRQVLREVPLGVGAPVWVDDHDFDLSRHLVHADSADLGEVIDACMSQPLPRGRPVWQLWIAPKLGDGRIGLVGKLHHCMVDGIAAVELGSLLLDPTPDPPPAEPDEWVPAPAPGRLGLLAGAFADLVRDELRLATIPARIAASPRRAREVARRSRRALAALADSARPAPRSPTFNPPISPRRHLGLVGRPIDDLLEVKRTLEVPLNDVVLAVVTSGVRRWLAGRGDRPVALKAMVPVNVRGEDGGDALGNRISFMFVDLPCEEPDPIMQVRRLHAETGDCKERETPEGGEDVLDLLSFAPAPVQSLFAGMVASPRAFNLVVSNIPGPREAAYLRGCRLRETYPVVPIADRHALSVGFTSIGDRACFGLYADPVALPDADELAACLDAAIDELRATTLEPGRRKRSRARAFA